MKGLKGLMPLSPELETTSSSSFTFYFIISGISRFQGIVFLFIHPIYIYRTPTVVRNSISTVETYSVPAFMKLQSVYDLVIM